MAISKGDSRLEKLLHAGPHRLAINLQTQPSPLHVGRTDIQVPRTRADHSGLQLTGVALLSQILYDELALKFQHATSPLRLVHTLARMFAPSENPIPKRGRLGNVFLSHFTA